ncbi:sugar phosphate isomerase/epimerase family protein [Halobellus rubicundus]|uniref:Sugar phosphate isomerase/epimerase family protein n=1 Tax=Halobellus rubicundus TaxID=2996466 RepID=A0ABD5MGR5_9EURY
MELGVLTAQPLGHMDRADAFDFLESLGVDAVELGTGGLIGAAHVDRNKLLTDEDARAKLRSELDERGLDICGFAVHDNPLHPDEERRERVDRETKETIELAAEFGVDRVITFSGLPAGAPGDSVPNWVTFPWPEEHAEARDYQWEVATEYWSDLGAYADDYGVDIAIEMHPNMLVYDPVGMVKLREATHERIGANLDPSHLWWQGIDIPKAIRYLAEHDAIHYVHAKDVRVYDSNAEIEGVFDNKDFDREEERAWMFRSVGYGHDEDAWRDIISTLRLVGYDDVLSIEWEDGLAEPTEGLEKAVDTLQRGILRKDADVDWVP